MSATRPLRIFLNYRREETSGHAGRLYDALAARFGDDRVFMDIDRIEPGLDFTEVIGNAVVSCDVLISLIGSHWATTADAKGRPRLENPEDFVRLELEAALRRDVRVIPALVQNAAMPSSDELPETLRPFARRHALELSDTRWAFDVGKLIQTLERLEAQLAEREAQARAEAEAEAKSEREAQNRAEAVAQDLPPAPDEASSSRVIPDTEPAEELEVARSTARAKPMPVDRPREARPRWGAKLFGRLDPRGELSWRARLGRVIALIAVAIILIAWIFSDYIVVLILVVLVVLAVSALQRRRRNAK